MSSRSRSKARSNPLNLQTLEQRDVPSGNVDAAIVGGVLTLKGDNRDNVVSIEVTATGVIVTPDGTTSVNGGAAGVAPPEIPGVPTGLKAEFGDGADKLSLANAVDIALPKGVSVDLGSGTNVLDLSASNTIQLGSLSVVAADGADTFKLVGGAGKNSAVTGKASFDLGNGNSNTTLTEVSFSKRLSFKSTGTGSAGITATNVQAPKGVTINTTGGFTATFNGGTIGAVNGSGLNASANFSNATVNGSVILRGVFTANILGDATTIDGSVNLSATNHSDGNVSSTWSGTSSVTGQIRQRGTYACTLIVPAGANSLTANAISLTGQLGQLLAIGSAFVTVNGNLTVNGSEHFTTNLATTSLSEVKGNVLANSTAPDATFTTNSFFKADKNVTLNFKNVSTNVTIGNGTAPVAILGNLSITTGAGNDQIALSNVVVSGKTKIKSGDGYDTLTIDKASVFTGAFSADLGAGDDTINIAQAAGAATPVKFDGKATILAGIGNDKLTLGKAGGDAGQAVSFAAGSKVDGGTGFNLFDDTQATFTGIVLGTGIVNWSP